MASLTIQFNLNQVKTADKQNETDVGSVFKVFSGYLQEFYTNADNFLVQGKDYIKLQISNY